MKHAGDQKSLYPLSQDHLGSRVGTRLTCDYSVLHSQHWDDSSRTEAMGETEGAANIFTNATLKMNKNEKWWESEQQGGEGEENWGGGSHFIVIQEAPGKEHYDSARPLDMAALPVLNQTQRLQLMAKIRNNHRLPLIILN